MPTKRNKAGKQQPYVPEGHGDASGEYAEHGTGSNQHYVSPEDVKRQLGYTPKEVKPETKTPKDLVNKLNGSENEKVSDDMKSIEYTKKLVEDAKYDGYFGQSTRKASVSITRGSLSNDEIGEFNKQIEDLYKEYPEMQKLTEIKVNNAKASSKGGYIATYGGYGSKNSYELYINAGWLEKTPGERLREENINFYKQKIQSIEQGLKNNEYSETSIQNVKEQLEHYKQQLENYYNNSEVYNVICKSSNRKERLKSLLAHELMHRVTQTFERYNVNKYAGDIEKNNALQTRYREIKQNIRDTYRQAVTSGDARKISIYATTSLDEFISEANSQISVGIETPQYIVDAINAIKEFVRSEK